MDKTMEFNIEELRTIAEALEQYQNTLNKWMYPHPPLIATILSRIETTLSEQKGTDTWNTNF